MRAQSVFPDSTQVVQLGDFLQGVQKKLKADQLLQKGIRNFEANQYPAAIAAWEQALKLYRDIGDRNGEGSALLGLGMARIPLSNYQQAIELLQQALKILQSTGNRNGEALAVMNLGNAYLSLSEYRKAIPFYEQSLTLFRQVRDAEREAEALSNLAIAHHNLGQYAKAITLRQEVLALYKRSQNRDGMVMILNNLGVSYTNLGQYDSAIEHYKQALAIAKSLNRPEKEAMILNNLGTLYLEQAKPAEAIQFYQQALPLYRSVGNRKEEAATLSNLANTYEDLSQIEPAIATFQQALSIQRAISDRNGEGLSLIGLGNLYIAAQKLNLAVEYLQQGISLLQAVGDQATQADALNSLGIAFWIGGQPSKAEAPLLQAIQIKETLRVGLKDDQKISIFEGQRNSYIALQRVLVALNQPERSLEIAERGRARAFVELLAAGQLNPTEIETFKMPAPTIQEIRQIAKEQNATLVQYSIVDPTLLYIWVVQPTGTITFRSVELPKTTTPASVSSSSSGELSQVVEKTRAAIAAKSSRNRSGSLAFEAEPYNIDQQVKRLYQLLIQPIADVLPTNPEQPVIFVPQGTLFLVPFPALQDANGQYLIQKHTILTVPAIQVLELTRQQKRRTAKNRGALVVGNPVMPKNLTNLPDSEGEAKAIAPLFQTQPLIGAQATESRVKQMMETVGVAHLATHGIFDEQQGLQSAIALTPSGNDDGFLRAAEIFGMTLKADLVVLSACNTGRGKITGDGVIGLSRSLIFAGTPSVIVSLWKVPDDSTAMLMTAFYQNLQTQPNKAKALRQAMLSTMQRYPDVRSWAAFTLIGEAE